MKDEQGRDPYTLLRKGIKKVEPSSTARDKGQMVPIKRIKRWFLKGENGELIEPNLNIDATVIRMSSGFGLGIHPLTSPQLFRK
jgi:hypothetical protein